MDGVLLDVVLARLDAEPLAETATELLLAACQGDDALATAAAGTAPPRPTRSEPVDASGVPEEPVGAFLKSITVRAFRGVGPEATLLCGGWVLMRKVDFQARLEWAGQPCCPGSWWVGRRAQCCGCR